MTSERFGFIDDLLFWAPLLFELMLRNADGREVNLLLQEHKALESTTRTALMQTAAKAASDAAQKPPLEVSNTSQLRDLAASAARIFGWDRSNKPGVQINQLVI